MTTFLLAPHVGTAASNSAVEQAVFAVSGMPRNLRLRVEELMYEHLSQPMDADWGVESGVNASEWSARGAGPIDIADVWDTRWYTRWRRDPSSPGAVCCREIVQAAPTELATFRAALDELAGTFRFHVQVCVHGNIA